MSEYQIAFDPSRCVACFGCIVACKTWRDMPVGLHRCRVEKKWHGKDLDTRVEYHVIACQHCVDAPCVAACPEKALRKHASTGVVTVDAATCTSCQACSGVCPYDVPQFPEKGAMQKCDLCNGQVDLEKEEPPCVRSCTGKALTLKKVDAEEKKKQQAALKAFCDAPYC